MAYIFVLGWVQLFLVATVWAEGPSSAPTWKEFQYYCHKHREGAAYFRIPPLPSGHVVFAPGKAIRATQVDFAYASLTRKLSKAVSVESEISEHFRKFKEWRFPMDAEHDFGRSFFPKRKALPVYYYRGELYPPDGHHRALISTYVGAETLPVLLEPNGDKSAMAPEQFFEFLRVGGHSFYEDAWGNPVPPVDLCDMTDNPNLELARILIAHVNLIFDHRHMEVDDLRGSTVVVGLKIDNDISFAEMYVAHALTRAGINWDGRRDYSIAELQGFIKVLKEQAHFRGPDGRLSRLNELMVFDTPIKLTRIPSVYRPMIYQHARTLGRDVGGMPAYPNLELAKVLMADLTVSFRKKGVIIEAASGPKLVIGGKTQYDTATIEQTMARAFDAAGVFWEGDKPTREELPDFLDVLKAANLEEPVYLFDQVQKTDDIPGRHGNSLLNHLQAIHCEEALAISKHPREAP